MSILQLIPDQHEQYRDELDRLGQLSAISQNLKSPITTWQKFSSSSETILLVFDNHDYPVGFIRSASRNLYLSPNPITTSLSQYSSVLCILDFFVSTQRRGYGTHLINHLISIHKTSIHSIAFDRPSKYMISFLKNKFNIGGESLIFQPNNFAISSKFFSS